VIRNLKLNLWFLYIGFAKGRPHAGTRSQRQRQGTARQRRGGRDGPNVSALSLHDHGNSLRNFFISVKKSLSIQN